MGRTLAESVPAFSEPRRVPSGTPNVVVIVLDDLGFADLRCFGSEIETPRIDALAESGLRYNNFHVTAICSASRACLLTGRNHHAVGMGFLPHPMPFPGYTARIPKSAGALPRLLRDAGFSTLAVGKWHLTPNPELTAAGPFDRWPLGLGFERYYGFLDGFTDQWAPDLVRDNGFIEPPLSPDQGYHVAEDLASQAIRFVQDQQQAAPGKPFFLYFAPGAVHWPHQVPDAWVEPYRNRFDDGWEAVRRRRFVRQQKLGVVPREATLTDRPSWVAPWAELSVDARRLFARQMEVYAGFLSHTDAQIGRLMDFLASIGVLENTLVMILSDNGASGDGGPHGALSNYAMAQVNDIGPMLNRMDEMGGPRVSNHYSWGWAWAGNTPFKLWKLYTWLGGVRAPLILRWPGRVPVDSGQVRTQFCHAVDLMPTILEATRVDPPEVLDGVAQQPFDGKSILATLGDPECPSPRGTQYFEMMGSRAIYHEGWKATTNHVITGFPVQRDLLEGSHQFDVDRWSLSNMQEDFSEAHDVSASHADKLRQLVELWWFEAGRNQVLPLMDETSGRLVAVEPPLYPDRHRYVYLPGGGPIVTPSLTAGFHIRADIEVFEDPVTKGIVWAQGQLYGGWACYMVDGRLVVTTRDGGAAQVIGSNAISPGPHQISVTYQPGRKDAGSISVTIDGQYVGAAPLTNVAEVSARKLLIGRDQGYPVCEDYQVPFSFTGQVHRVVLEIPSAARSEPAHDLDDALRRD